jgi:ParB-like chromosome segregation protein Spo0J
MELIPYINNTRTHDEKQIKQIASSIKEFGFNNPILIDEKGEIIAGHGRLLASELLKLEEVPCIELKHLTKAQKKAYIIADNKIALNAGWNEELLKLEIENLKELDFDLVLLGFDSLELEDILGESQEIEMKDFFEEIEQKEKVEKTFICEHCGKESRLQ